MSQRRRNMREQRINRGRADDPQHARDVRFGVRYVSHRIAIGDEAGRYSSSAFALAGLGGKE